MSISTTHQPVTSRTPSGWAAGHEYEAQSATFRALAWSEDEDGVAEPLQYAAEEYREPARDRRSTLLCGIATAFAAAAIGGLVLTVVNLDDGPVAIPTELTRPAVEVVNPQPSVETGGQGGQAPASVPAAVKAARAPARAVPPAGAPVRASVAPAPRAAAPVFPAPQAPAAAAPAPQAAAPTSAAPQAKPPVWVPPVIAPPVVSLPEMTVQPLPIQTIPSLVPTLSHPTVAERPPLDVPTVLDPAIPAPAAPAAPTPVISVKPDVIIPTFAFGSDH